MSKNNGYGLQLILIRHAKSDWSLPGQPDFDRGLNARGKRNAPMMADVLFKRLKKVDAIISSPAVRAIRTASYFAERYGMKQEEVILKDSVYEASVMDLLRVVWDIPGDCKTIILCGHNPGLSHLVDYLTGEMMDMPTCAIAGLRFEADEWKQISRGLGTLIFYEYPRKYEPRHD